MKGRIFNKLIPIALFLILFGSFVSTSSATGSFKTIASIGSVIYWPRVDVTINASKVIGYNSLSLGFMLDWNEWKTFIDSPTQRQLAQDASFKLVRVFDFRQTTPRLMPCTYWDESTKTGSWSWGNIDAITQKILESGGEPLFCLGYARTGIQNYIPPGMAVNPNTELPYPDSYAAYAKEWVKHFKTLGWPVRYYQIMNEPHTYFGWNPSDTTKLAHYVELWNSVARAMRAENSNILLSHDAITQKRVLDYWIIHGDNIDYLDFHKYDSDTIGQYSDVELFSRAETRGFEEVSWSGLHSIDVARQKWFTARGKWLQVVISESNLNSAWQSGTDPKIQQMTGAVWLALLLRISILKGVNYNIYYEFSSSKSWEESNRQSGGFGFGMINLDDNQPWFSYYVQKIIGSKLKVGDEILEIKSSSDDIRTVAWMHEGKLIIVLICKVYEQRTVILKGTSGSLNMSWIDDSTQYETPSIQTSISNSADPLLMNKYTVALLEYS